MWYFYIEIWWPSGQIPWDLQKNETVKMILETPPTARLSSGACFIKPVFKILGTNRLNYFNTKVILLSLDRNPPPPCGYAVGRVLFRFGGGGRVMTGPGNPFAYICPTCYNRGKELSHSQLWKENVLGVQDRLNKTIKHCFFISFWFLLCLISI